MKEIKLNFKIIFSNQNKVNQIQYFYYDIQFLLYKESQKQNHSVSVGMYTTFLCFQRSVCVIGVESSKIRVDSSSDCIMQFLLFINCYCMYGTLQRNFYKIVHRLTEKLGWSILSKNISALFGLASLKLTSCTRDFSFCLLITTTTNLS